jgi:hypothetical protein
MTRDDLAGLIGLGLPIARKPDSSERRAVYKSVYLNGIVKGGI